MSRVPIRLRLTLIFAGAMAIVLAAVGTFVYFRVAHDLDRSLDKDLRTRAQVVSALVQRGGSVRDAGTLAQTLTPAGRVVDATPDLRGQPLLTPSQLAEAPGLFEVKSIPGQDEHGRAIAEPLNGRVLIVGATLEHRDDTLASLKAAFLVGGPVALLLMSIGGYLLAGAALRPIEAMRLRASEISTTSLGERLPVPPADDEVARLGKTLNAMLDRIEDGVARERRFVADASHELRTPLATLRAELELALRRSRTTQELEASVRSAAAETDRLSRIADDLLLLARADRGALRIKREPTDLVDLLEAVRDRFDARAELEGRSVTVDAEETVAQVDRLRLEQALGNLVDNAFRHGRGAITLAAARHNGAVEVHVLDHGPGFPPEFREHAFKAFSRAAPSGEGSGLGLAIVETITRAHGGSVGAGHGRDGGADVWIRLPL
jgi:two-component system, OmpR family, sensor kinase